MVAFQNLSGSPHFMINILRAAAVFGRRHIGTTVRDVTEPAVIGTEHALHRRYQEGVPPRQGDRRFPNLVDGNHDYQLRLRRGT
jgi:hypothetical protein